MRNKREVEGTKALCTIYKQSAEVPEVKLKFERQKLSSIKITRILILIK